ncbi:MAG: hypothetical protein IPI31_11150 [Bacteroidetes bacterium]|nr:hypothetical protein [Bacteroidota bacterium]MBK7568367.1 hypothetical protein [Bacteroidota bacterium]
MRQALTIISILALFFASCAKDSIIHEDLIIDGNVAPPIDGVSQITLNSYINNLYIDLYGRAATESELLEQSDYLIEFDYSVDAREDIVENLMTSWEYYKNINVLTTQKYLVSLDSFSLKSQIDYWVYIIDIYYDTGLDVEALYYTIENEKLILLSTAHVELYEGSIFIDEYFKRFINNYFYDMVNMGSENFVISCFQNLFHRYPTDDELLDAVSMVDGASSQIFLQDGSSKSDFIDIIIHSPEFYQGQTIDVFNSLLARAPNSEEMDMYGQEMMDVNHFNSVKIKLLISEEYAGF